MAESIGGSGIGIIPSVSHHNKAGQQQLCEEDSWSGRVGGGGWATSLVMLFLLFWRLLTSLARPRNKPLVSPLPPPPQPPPPHKQQQQQKAPLDRIVSPSSSSSPTGASKKIISDADLRDLLHDLDRNLDDGQGWEDVVNRSNSLISYNAKCCRQKDAPVKYVSTTIFEECSTELLKNFYMDNEYRKKWDKTVLDHEQLEVDELNAIEFGRTIKKFPLLTPREYVLAWCTWEGKDSTFYCFIKDTAHHLAPRHKKYVRVGFFRSGWRIIKVPGREACEIKMVHQEDAGLNAEMAKLAFARGVWSYICKMNSALREYTSSTHAQPRPLFIHGFIRVPPGLESDAGPASCVVKESVSTHSGLQMNCSNVLSKTWIAKGLLIIGGVVCLSRGHSTLATHLAMACFLKKLTRKDVESEETKLTEKAPVVTRGKWTPKHLSCSQNQKSCNGGLLSPRHSRATQTQ